MFNERLKQLRESNGYSMDKLAEIYNKQFNGKLNKSTLSRYENGLQEPIYTVVVNFSKLFNVSVDYLACLSQNKVVTKKILSPDRNIKNYYKLNSVGKNKVGAYIDDLMCNPQYVYDKPNAEMVAYDLDDMIGTGWKPKKPETTAD